MKIQLIDNFIYILEQKLNENYKERDTSKEDSSKYFSKDEDDGLQKSSDEVRLSTNAHTNVKFPYLFFLECYLER